MPDLLVCPYCKNTEFIGPHRIRGYAKTVIEFSFWRTTSLWGHICANCGYVRVSVDGYGLQQAHKHGRKAK